MAILRTQPLSLVTSGSTPHARGSDVFCRHRATARVHLGIRPQRTRHVVACRSAEGTGRAGTVPVRAEPDVPERQPHRDRRVPRDPIPATPALLDCLVHHHEPFRNLLRRADTPDAVWGVVSEVHARGRSVVAEQAERPGPALNPGARHYQTQMSNY